MTTSTTNQTETYPYGISKTMTNDNQIAIIRTQGDMSRDAINTWASLLILTMQEWQSNRPLALLHDLTHPSQGLTPYTRERTLDLMKRRPTGMTVYSAVILPDTFMHRIISMFLRTPIFQQDDHNVRVFRTEAEGIEWLYQMLG